MAITTETRPANPAGTSTDASHVDTTPDVSVHAVKNIVKRPDSISTSLIALDNSNEERIQ